MKCCYKVDKSVNFIEIYPYFSRNIDRFVKFSAKSFFAKTLDFEKNLYLRLKIKTIHRII